MTVYVWNTELKNAYIGIPYPTSILLNKSAISLTTVWQTEQLTATIKPTVSDKTITWTTSDSTVATVVNGLVTCVTPWNCTITATTVNGLIATCGVVQKEYQEVERVWSSWTQYINTWFTASVNTRIETTLSVASSQPREWAVFFGVTRNDSSWDWILGRIYASTASDFNPRFCNTNYDEAQVNMTTDIFHDIVLAANTLEVDNSSYTITTSWTPYQSPMDIFWWNNGGSHGWRCGSCKIKSLTIIENGTPVRDFIPCYRVTDWVIWMYDEVNDVFYTNQWSWTFTKWPDVN